MRKIGRNDPCYCGSGIKYKKCCIETDQKNNVTRIINGDEEQLAQSPHNQKIAPTKTRLDNHIELIDSLPWINEVYRMVAHKLLGGIAQEYPPEFIKTAIMIWYDFSSEEQPQIKKLGVYAAAVEYFVAYMKRISVTQKHIANKYDVSVATVSQRYYQLEDFVYDRIQEKDYLQEATQTTQPIFQQGRFSMEREMRRITELMGEREFDSIEEMNEFINSELNNPQLKTASKTLSKKDQAQELIYDAMEISSSIDQKRLAKKALELYPNCTDAYVLLAENEKSLTKALKYYKQGLEAGRQDLGIEFFKENTGHFWGVIESRPFMRAKQGYAICLWQLGQHDAAIEQFKELLLLNPIDNQGNRYFLITAYLEIKNFKAASQLMDNFPEHGMASFAYNQILVEYGKHGLTKRLDTLLDHAKKINPHVISYLLQKKVLPNETPAYYGFGDDNEATAYVIDHIELWQREPELLKWLTQYY